MNEKITIAIVDLSGSPKSGATVELRFSLSVYTGTELGSSGNYHWSSIPLGKYFLWVNGADTGESFAVGEGELARLGYDDGKVLKSTASSIIWSDGFVSKTGDIMSGALYNLDKVVAGWNGNTSAYTDYTLLDGNGFAHYKFLDLIGTLGANGQYKADSINLFSSLGTATSFNVQVDTDSHSSASTALANAVGHASTFLNNQSTYDLSKQAAYSIWSDDAGGYTWFGSPYANSATYNAKQFGYASDGTNSVEFYTNDLKFNGQSIFDSIPALSMSKHGVVRTESGGFIGAWSIDNSTGQLSLSASNDYYLKGVKGTVESGVVIALPTTVPIADFPNPYHYGAIWIVYVDIDNVVKYSMVWPDILQVVLLARIYIAYNSNATAIEHSWIYEERHSSEYGAYDHFVDHFGIGAHVVGTDPVLAGYNIQPVSPTDADNTYSITCITIADEDIALSIPSIAEAGAKPVTYKEMWRWDEVAGNALGYLYENGGRIMGNISPMQHGYLSPTPSGSFVNYYMVCFTRTDGAKRLMLMPGANFFVDGVSAASTDLLTDLYLSDLDPYETVVLYRITYGVSDSYSTTGRCRIEAVNYLKEGRGSYQGVSSILNANLQNLNVSNNTNLNGNVAINATLNINGLTTLSPTTKIGGSILGNVVVVTDSSGNLTVANSISTTELGYLDGVTSSIQTQLNSKIDAINALNTSATEQEKAGILGVVGGFRVKQSSDLSQILLGHTLSDKSDWKVLIESNQTPTNNFFGIRLRQDGGTSDYPLKIQRITGGAIEFYRPVKLSLLSASQYLKTDANKVIVSQSGIPWSDITGEPTTLAGYGITDALNTSATEQEKAGILGVVGGFRVKQSSDLSQILLGHTLSDKSDWKVLIESNQTPTNNFFGIRLRQDGGTSDYPLKIQRITGGAIEFYRPVQALNNDFLVSHDTTKNTTLQVTSADTTVQRASLALKHKTTSASGNGLGVILEALGEDSGASEFRIGAIDFVRTTANGTGDVYLQSSLSGVYQNVLRLKSDKGSEFFGQLTLNSANYSASQYLKTDANKVVVTQSGIPWSDVTGKPTTPPTHASTHAGGGSDEITSLGDITFTESVRYSSYTTSAGGAVGGGTGQYTDIDITGRSLIILTNPTISNSDVTCGTFRFIGGQAGQIVHVLVTKEGLDVTSYCRILCQDLTKSARIGGRQCTSGGQTVVYWSDGAFNMV